MPALHFTKDNFDQKVLKSEKPVMVDFFAIWCGPCKMTGPVIEELAQEYKTKAVIGKVNIDDQEELAKKHSVMSIPTVLVFKNGKEVERIVGFPGKEAYENLLKKHL